MSIRIPMALLEDPGLTTREKMLLIALMAMGMEGSLDSQRLALLMGADEKTVQSTLDALARKGYLEKETPPLGTGTVLKSGEGAVRMATFAPMDSREDQIQQILEIVEEKLNYREASIILNLSGNDVDRIARLYRQVKKSQFSDPLGMLINGLQKKDDAPAHHPNRHQASELSSGDKED